MTTPKQAYWIRKLRDEKAYAGPRPTDDDITRWTTKQASFTLSLLFDAPRKAATDRPVVDYSTVVEGYYLSPDDEVIHVVPNKAGTRNYGKVLYGTRWSYERGAIDQAVAGHRITLEEAAHYGHTTGHCLTCGAKLDKYDEGENASAAIKRSIARGIGPVCWKHLGGAYSATTLETSAA